MEWKCWPLSVAPCYLLHEHCWLQPTPSGVRGPCLPHTVQNITDPERMQTPDLCLLAKKQRIKFWRQAQITTCFYCGRGARPKIPDLSVTWICYDIVRLLANTQQNMDSNTSQMAFHFFDHMFQDFSWDLLDKHLIWRGNRLMSVLRAYTFRGQGS